MNLVRIALLPLVVTVLVGCEATAPLGALATLPADSAGKCATLCKDASLEMSSLVIVHSSIGCVCSVPAKAAAKDATGARDASAATVAAQTIIDDEEAQQRAAAARR
jgi:hypothetical protein